MRRLFVSYYVVTPAGSTFGNVEIEREHVRGEEDVALLEKEIAATYGGQASVSVLYWKEFDK